MEVAIFVAVELRYRFKCRSRGHPPCHRCLRHSAIEIEYRHGKVRKANLALRKTEFAKPHRLADNANLRTRFGGLAQSTWGVGPMLTTNALELHAGRGSERGAASACLLRRALTRSERSLKVIKPASSAISEKPISNRPLSWARPAGESRSGR